MRDDLEPAGRAQRSAVAAEDRDLIATIGATCGLDQRLRAGEHLERTGDVEALNIREGEDRDLARRLDAWASLDHARRTTCPQGQISHDFCHRLKASVRSR